MRKILIAILFVISLSIAFSVAISAQGYGVFDGLGIISSSEQAKINDTFKEAYEETGIGFYMCVYSNPVNTVEKAIVMDIDVYYGRYGVSVYSMGNVSHKIDTEKLQHSVSYDVACQRFSDSAKSLTSTAVASYNYRNIKGFLLVLLIPTILTIVIFVIVVIVSYKKKLRGAIYPLNKFTTLDLTDHSDIYTHSHTTRYKYRDSNKR